jgi:cysteinyl-tRNA synthetase
MIKIFNTLGRKVEEFKPLNPDLVTIYACGPTVYDYTHIGHLRKYIGDDLLIRTLVANGYKVKHVMNITDVGHLTSDEDAGDDKLEKGAKEKNMTVWEVAKSFEEYFFKSIYAANVNPANVAPRATEHINEQVKLIKKLEENGFTYQTKQAVYFDLSKFPNYGELTGQKLEEKSIGVRDEVVTDPEKRNPQDFALWFFTVGHFSDHVMRWPSPWGEGFPGWHIECSAMSMEYLGNTLDFHTGGIDHIPVHHTNEIAQSEAATGQKFVNYWVHHEFLNVDGEKMSKSKKNFYRVEDIEEKGFDLMALRFLFLTAHYRDHMNFTWDSLRAAQNALNNLRETVRGWSLGGVADENFMTKFMEAINEDLNTSIALALMWNMAKSDLPSEVKSATILEMDNVLGLKLDEYVGKQIEVPAEVQELVEKREKVRAEKNFEMSDKLRKEILDLGYEVKDTANGPELRKV